MHGKIKHFLDSSIVQPILFSPIKVKDYYQSKINYNSTYLSDYVIMEIRRSYLMNVLYFYFMLKLPAIETVGEGLKYWSEKFGTSPAKAILKLIPDICSNNNFDLNSKKDKSRALIAIGRHIKKVNALLKYKFKNIGSNVTHCERAKVQWKISISKIDQLNNDLSNIQFEFDNKDNCRKKCKVEDVFLVRNKTFIDIYINNANGLSKNNDTRGYLDIVERLKKIQKDGQKYFTCNKCGGIGDAIIAIEMPVNMQLDHIDKSFNYLCTFISKSHSQQPSVTKVLNTIL